MPNTLRIAERTRHDHEDLFLERYARLFERAIRLTRDRQQAEDLVQDAFVQWTLSRTKADDIRNLDAYLFTMLQHLHVSQVRRAIRAKQTPLDLIDHDTAETAWKGTDAAARLQAAETLSLVCEYACNRRTSSRTGVVLLLRYFHGYYTREIAALLKVPASSVDGFLHLARREARAYASNPSRLSVIGAPDPVHMPRPVVSAGGGCIDGLRANIFALAHQQCFDDAWFADTYRHEFSESVSCATVADLATCPRCLDQANRLLGLPLLADRYPTDSLGTDHRSGPGAGDGRGSSGDVPVARLRRKASDVFEHRPHELSMAVNGFFVASQRIAGSRSEQSVSLTAGETIGFVEVFSEQQVRLAFAAVQAIPDGDIEQRWRVCLSDARTLDVSIDFTDARPVLRVAYLDPSWQPAPLVESEVAGVASAAGRFGKDLTEPGESEDRVGSRWWEAAWAWLRRPQVIPAAVLLLFAFWWLYGSFASPRLSAEELLSRAVAADDAGLRRDAGLDHRVFLLEERRLDDGVVVARTRVEVWRRSDGQTVARRAYDESTGALTAVEITSAGSTTVYVPGEAARAQSRDAAVALAAIEAGEVWRIEPSPAHFRQLSRHLDPPTVQASESAYVLSGGRPSDQGGRGVVSAALTLTRQGLRPILQAFVVRGARGMREYRFSERLSERVPGTGAADRLFQPDASVLPRATSPSSPPKAGIEPGLTREHTASLLVETFYLLNAAGATQGEQVSVTASRAGVRIDGIVESAARKRTILKWLSPLRARASVAIDVRTVDEATGRQRRLGPTQMERGVEARQDRIGAYEDLHRYLIDHPSIAWPLEPQARARRIEEDVLHVAAEVLERSGRALQRAWALQRLIAQVPPDVARTLDSDTREKWYAMVREHARACRRELANLRGQLAPVFKPEMGVLTSPQSERVSASAVGEAAAALRALVAELDDAVRSAFTLSSSEVMPPPVMTGVAFWDALGRAEAIAGSVSDVE